MTNLAEAVESADSQTDPDAYIDQVKRAVIGSIEDLDSSVRIKDTGYFNHSAVPDFVLTWADRGKTERPLYVRRSFDELEAGHDVERLAATAPIFLSVGPSEATDREVTERRLGIDPTRDRQVLVTDSATVDRFTGEADGSSPLSGAVAGQILPAGRGLIDASKAESVLNPNADVLRELETVLSADALESVSVVAGVIAAALGADVPISELDVEPFSLREARELLPWLLSNQNVTGNSDFWSYVASRLTLKHLEHAHEDLQDVDLTNLCKHGWTQWTAQGARLGAVVRGPEEVVPDGWYMRKKLLTCEVGDAALRFATYGQALKENDKAVSSAAWEVIEPRLAEVSLLQVILRGLVRSIRIGAEEASDVKDDTRSVLESVTDRYYIDELTIRYGLASEERVVRLDLASQLAFNQGQANVRDLANALAQIAAYRQPINLSVFESE